MKIKILSLIGLSFSFLTGNAGAFQNGDVITFDAGVFDCATGGTYPDNCNDDLTDVVSGSYSAFDINGNNQIEANEKIAISPGSQGGIVVGQIMTSDLSGACPSSPPVGGGGMDSPWCFNGNYGVHHFPSIPVTDNGDGTLDFSGLNVRWGDDDVPMLGSTATLNCMQVDCRPGDQYMIDYQGNVPSSHGAGPLWVVHLQSLGEVGVFIQTDGGDTQECSTIGGSHVTFNTITNIPEGDSVDSIYWKRDGVPVGVGHYLTTFIPLGTHTVTAELTTVNNESGIFTQSITIRDTTAPQVTANVIDRITDGSVGILEPFNFLSIDAEGVDVCDLLVTVEAMVGVPVSHDDSVVLRKFDTKTIIDVPGITLNVTATDDSGNTSSAMHEMSLSN